MAAIDYNPVGGARPTGGELLPKGKYLAIITDSRVDTPKSDTSGRIIWLERSIQEPAQYRNRKIFQRINVRNKSPKAEQIGQEELNGLLDALGMGNTVLKDTVQMHNKPHIIQVGIESDAAGKYDDVNNVRRCFPPSAGGVGAQASAAAPAALARPAPFHQQPRPQAPAAPGNAAGAGAAGAAPSTAAPAQSATGDAGQADQQGGDVAVEERPPAQAPAPAPAPTPAPALSGALPPWMQRRG